MSCDARLYPFQGTSYEITAKVIPSGQFSGSFVAIAVTATSSVSGSSYSQSAVTVVIRTREQAEVFLAALPEIKETLREASSWLPREVKP